MAHNPQCNVQEFVALISGFGKVPDDRTRMADFNEDGVINIQDWNTWVNKCWRPHAPSDGTTVTITTGDGTTLTLK